MDHSKELDTCEKSITFVPADSDIPIGKLSYIFDFNMAFDTNEIKSKFKTEKSKLKEYKKIYDKVLLILDRFVGKNYEIN